MALDPSIALQIRPAQIDTPLEAQSKALTLRDLMGRSELQGMQLQQARRGLQQDEDYAEALRGGVGPDGKLDYGKTLGALASSGNAKGYAALVKQQGEAQKSSADLAHTTAQTKKLTVETDEAQARAQIAKSDQAMKDIAGFQTPDEARAALLRHVQAGDVGQEVGAMMYRMISDDPNAFARWKLGMLTRILSAKEQLEASLPKLATVNTGQQTITRDANPMSNTFNQQVMAPVQMQATPGEVMTDRRSRDSLAQAERHFQANQNAPKYMDSDGGLVALPGRVQPGQAPVGTPVMGPDGRPLGKPLKDIPGSANTAIITNAQNLARAQQALAMLQGSAVGDLQGDPKATGWKGYAPQPLLNRMDPGGVETRAMIADLGSMVIHDRSGAAVTAAESPRLMPFIPLVTDDPAVAQKKLQRFIQVYQQEQQALSDTYSRAQGYKPSPVTEQTGAPATTPRQAPPVPVKGDDDYNRLPKGTRFITPDGKLGTKS